jgi:alpha-tubulin suppressor-like RCC1 family protein
MAISVHVRAWVMALPFVTLAGGFGACGARTGNDLDAFAHDAAPDTRQPDTRQPDTAFPDTRPSFDTLVGPDTLVAPDSLRPDTLVPESDGAVVEVLSAKSMSLGDDHTCVVLPDRTVKCWGLNENGQLGDGTVINRSKPAPVPGVSGVLEIVAGGRHNCVRTAGGAVSCWGWNERGQLGDGTTIEHHEAVPVPGLAEVVQIAGGHWHTCVLLSDSTARCWGENSRGQLGDGTTTRRLTPTAVSSLSGVARLTAGCEHTCAVMHDHTLQCWGSNAFHQIDFGISDYSSPHPVKTVTDVADASLGCYTTCYRSVAGRVTCIGRDLPSGGTTVDSVAQVAASTQDHTIHRRLGDTVTDDITGSAFSALTGVIEVAAGWQHACARQDKALWCAGFNFYGEVGDGTTHDHFGLGAAVKVPLD